MGLIFGLDTAARDFAAWLEEETQTLPLRVITIPPKTPLEIDSAWLEDKARLEGKDWLAVGGGRLTLQRAVPNGPMSEPTSVQIDGNYTDKDGSYPLSGAIKFQLRRVSSDRVSVEAISHERALAAYYLELLERIAVTWSEAQSVILPYVQQVRAQLGIYQPGPVDFATLIGAVEIDAAAGRLASDGQQTITRGQDYPLSVSTSVAAAELEFFYRQWRGTSATPLPDHKLTRKSTESDLILFVIEGFHVPGHDEITDTVIEFRPRPEGCMMYFNPNESNLFNETLLLAEPFLEDFLRHIKAWLRTESQPAQPAKSAGIEKSKAIYLDNRALDSPHADWDKLPTIHVDPVTSASTLQSPTTGKRVIVIPQEGYQGNEPQPTAASAVQPAKTNIGKRRNTGKRVRVKADWIKIPRDQLLPCVSMFVDTILTDINQRYHVIEVEPGTLAIRESAESDRAVDAIEIVILSSRGQETSIEIDALESHVELARMLWEYLYLGKGTQPAEPSAGDGQQPMNIIADNRGGTVTKTTNTDGQTIIGGTVNAGYEYQSNGIHSAIVPSSADIPLNMAGLARDKARERYQALRNDDDKRESGQHDAVVPILPTSKYSARRQKVLDMTLARVYDEREIAKEIKESLDTVKNDKKWLRRKGYLP